MREAARALDDVSDHLGAILRRADELLAEWSRFGGQVRAQVEREAAAIGEVVDGAVARAASSGLERALAERLQALTGELERLEQRARAAARVVAEQRDADRRVLWLVVTGIVLANALLVALLLRKPDAAPAVEPIRIESTAAEPPPQAGPARGNAPAAGSAEPATPAAPASPAAAGSAAEALGTSPPVPAGANTPGAGASAGSNAANATLGARAAPNAPPPAANALPPRAGNPRPHKKLP